jgi:FkbM family methyltransferase
MQKETRLNNRNLRLNLRSEADESVFYEIFTQREYNVLDEIIKKATSPIVDIGAHIGLFSLYANSLNEAQQIFAYEPEEENFKALKEHLKLNDTKNINIKNVAVTAQEGTVLLCISPDSHNHSIIEIENATRTIKVPSTTLKKIVEKLGHVSLLKMDCEGAEFEILESTPLEFLNKIDNIYIEYHTYTEEMNPSLLKIALDKAGFHTSQCESRYDARFGFILAKRK